MSSDQDTTSDCSNTMEYSPRSYPANSPYSSPSQQVPQLANCMNILSCADDTSMHIDTSGNHPLLRIIEQPQGHFRFRYKSEMVGTHGCLLGRTYTSSKTKTHPSVELVNYTGHAIVRCSLAQCNNGDDHPHQLLEDEQDGDVSAEVGPGKGYEVRFAGMGIIHTAKKDVPSLLFAKYSTGFEERRFTAKQLRTHCENIAKNINLNIVRLKFTAHDKETNSEICPPVFSEPIHNMKSAATNDLKICRMSRVTGRAKGGDDVYLFVEKVNKRNIEIRLIQLSPSGEVLWTAKGQFVQTDVHHQYAIVFRTPPYDNPQTPIDVEVFVELLRPSDGRTSNRMSFTYLADHVYKQSKKRKANSYSSFDSSSSGSIRSVSELPVTVIDQASATLNYNNELTHDMTTLNNSVPFVQTQMQMHGNPLGDALFGNTVQTNPMTHKTVSPVLSQPNVPDPPQIHLTSTETRELHSMLKDAPLPSGDYKDFLETFKSDDYLRDTYFREHNLPNEDENMTSLDFFSSSMKLVPDSGRIKSEEMATSSKSLPKIKSNDGYTALYKQEDGAAVKQEHVEQLDIELEVPEQPLRGPYDNLVKELCNIMRNKTGYKKQVIRDKLERLFDVRLSNGDTFLHMTLCKNILASMEFIIKLLKQLKMAHLANIVNNESQTVLHLAVMNDLPTYIPFLIANGCDPTIQDKDGHNAIHYAIIYQSGLAECLSSIWANNTPCDLNASNNEKQTALHLAVEYGLEESCRLLLSAGASYNARDSSGRTPLHLAAYDHRLLVLRVLLAHIPTSDVDVVDGRGNTALQIVCGGQNQENSYHMAKLLLEKGAHPLMKECNTDSAWVLSSGNPDLRALIKQYLPTDCTLDDEMDEEDIKSEPEDEYESADDGEYQEKGLQAMQLYIQELSDILDRNGGWRELALRLKCDSLLNWYEKTVSPTQTLLNQIKEVDEHFTSRSLAMTLRDMGEVNACEVIMKHID